MVGVGDNGVKYHAPRREIKLVIPPEIAVRADEGLNDVLGPQRVIALGMRGDDLAVGAVKV